MVNSSALRAIYGGTFDPVHFGHLKPVEALAKQVALQQIIIMPNNVPPHRPQPQASSEQRKTMVELAIKDNPLYRLDTRELQRETPSWTVETLEQVRQEIGANQPLAFIIGQDSLLNLSQWYRWEHLCELCHLLVCKRPGYPVKMPGRTEERWLAKHQTTDIHALHTLPSGKVFFATTPEYAISATDIRRRIMQGQPCDNLLPQPVLEFIKQNKLYQQHPER